MSNNFQEYNMCSPTIDVDKTYLCVRSCNRFMGGAKNEE